MSRSVCLWANLRTIQCDWSHSRPCWPLPELLVNAAPGAERTTACRTWRTIRGMTGRWPAVASVNCGRPGMIACGDSSCCGLEVPAAEVVVSAAEVPAAEVVAAVSAEVPAAEVPAAVSAAEIVPAVVIARVAVAVLVDEDRR